MFYSLVKIRCIQIKRYFDGAGPGVLLALIFWIFLVLLSFKAYNSDENYLIPSSIALVALLRIQSKRRDLTFIQTHFKYPKVSISLEFIFYLFSFIISSLFTKHWFMFPMSIIAAILVPFIPIVIKPKAYLKVLGRVFNPLDFEWISGIRNSFYYFIPIYLLALSFSWLRIFPLVLLWILTQVICNFFNYCEPIGILREYSNNADEFIKKKSKKNALYAFILYAPVIIINTIFNVDFWFVNLAFVVCQISLLIAVIGLKYSYYSPSSEGNYNTGKGAILTLGATVPYLLPIALYQAKDYYETARDNLKNYLDAEN